MANLMLMKPAAGTRTLFQSTEEARIQLGFATGDTVLERDGNDLVFRFDDGSSIVLQDFYTAYTKDTMPDFVIEGAEITGQQFFAALNEPDLMPAAGPAAASTASGGRYYDYANSALLDGVDRLGGLDMSSNRAFGSEERQYSADLVAPDDAIDSGVIVTPTNASLINPDILLTPAQPDRPSGDSSTQRDQLEVNEANLREGGCPPLRAP